MSARARAAVAALVLVSAAAGWAWWNSPERQIRRALAEIAAGFSHDQVASPLGAVSAVADMQPLLAEDIVLEPGGRFDPIRGRSGVLAAAARLRTALPALRVQFTDVVVSLAPDGTTASVEGTVSAVVTDRAGQETTDAREFAAQMRLVNGRWVVARARAVEVLERVS